MKVIIVRSEERERTYYDEAKVIEGVCQITFMISGRGMDIAKRRGQNGKCWFDAQGESSSTRPMSDDRRPGSDRVIERIGQRVRCRRVQLLDEIGRWYGKAVRILRYCGRVCLRCSVMARY